MSDLLLESIRAVILCGVVAYLWAAGRSRIDLSRKGWWILLGGFCLLLFGSVLDITDNFEELNGLVVFGDTPTQAFLEKIVGFLGGFSLVAYGLVRWIPTVTSVEGTRELSERLSEVNRTLEERAYEQEKLVALAENCSDFIWMVGEDGQIIYANRAAKELLGIGCTGSACCMRRADCCAADEKYYRQVVIKRALTEGSWSGELSFRHHLDGECVQLLLNVFTVTPPDSSKPTCVAVISRDITDRKRAEDELREAKETAERAARAKSEFLANMSHEIRTPMSTILGFTDLLRLQLVGDEDALENLDAIEQSGRHLLDLINDILDLSKIESEKVVLEHIPCSPVQTLRDVLSTLKLRAREKDLVLAEHYESAVPEVFLSDPTRLRQVLLNIVGNAIKFTETGSIVVSLRVVELGDGGKQLEYKVKDTGTGIPPAKLEHIFAPFAQADESTTRLYGGTGLGLSISRRLAKLFGGHIMVKSEEGLGSVFTFAIPCDIPEGTRIVTPSRSVVLRKPDPSIVRKKGNVLLVEDVSHNQIVFRRYLERRGMNVDSASSGDEALEKYSPGKYNLVLLDIQMPGKDGFETLAELRRRGADEPVLALTAHAMTGYREKCLAAGFDAYLAKPLGMRDFLDAVEPFLARRRAATAK